MIRKDVLERTFSILLTDEQFTDIDWKVWHSLTNVCNMTVDQLIGLYRNEIIKIGGLH